MSKAHYDEVTGLFIEEHQRNKLARVSFTVSVMDKYSTFEERAKLVNALGDEINEIPADWIPYGTFFRDGRMFVYASGWDEEDQMFYMLIDLAQAARLVGFIPEGEEENLDEEPADPVLH